MYAEAAGSFFPRLLSYAPVIDVHHTAPSDAGRVNVEPRKAPDLQGWNRACRCVCVRVCVVHACAPCILLTAS